MELTRSIVSLPAFEPAWFQQVRSEPHLLSDISNAVGGPFHVLYPPRFTDNLRSFQLVMEQADVDGKVYFGKKANKSGCWLPSCAENGAGVDVSSVPELVHALGNGVRGEDIVVTGPTKSRELLWLAARHRSLVAVDAPDELEHVITVAYTAGPVRILLRVLPEVNPHTRFGFGRAELDRAVERCVEEREYLLMEGFSFHLSGYEVSPRASLASEMVDRCVAVRKRGLFAGSVSIGGGFAAGYVEVDTWERFKRDYDPQWFHSNKEFTHFYPYHQSPVGADMFAEILASPVPGRWGDVAGKFAGTGTRLLLEPGRALLDGSGFTVFPVQGFKQRDGYGIITVSGISMSISEQWKGSEYLPDPLLWPSHECGDAVAACVGGASCLEYDMLSWRKIPFPRIPQPGELLIYPNTAGYQMDKNETEFHQIPLPTRVVLCDGTGGFQWRLDRSSTVLRQA